MFAMTDIYLDTVERSQADTNGFELLVSVSDMYINFLVMYKCINV